MSNGMFKYEDCLLKHHIRTEAWLPLCKTRLAAIRQGKKVKDLRRLRYFTFCAVGALDVLMLDVAKVIHPSENGGFDSVVFFDMTPDYVVETKKSIPGAIGFPGDFVDIVLLEDPNEAMVVDGKDPLVSPETARDDRETRLRQLNIDQKHKFIACFPFDVINLDLEEFLFKPTQDLPGKVINALRKVFAWQRRSFTVGKKTSVIDGFSLMFTTQIGPPNLTQDYIEMLGSRLKANISADAELKDILSKKIGFNDIDKLCEEKFDLFFILGMPKILAATLMEEDWYIDDTTGVKIFEFERPSKSGPYKMLHLVMNIKRKVPPRDKRAPGTHSTAAQDAYKTVVRQIFTDNVISISDASVDKPALTASLAEIKTRRRKYNREIDLN
jgi:hypothetical protein